MNYRVIMSGWNCAPWVQRAMESVRDQTVKSFTVCVTSDGSVDGMGEIVAEFCEREGWSYFINDENRGTLWNQVRAIRTICEDPEDVIVFVDCDDRLADRGVFKRLDGYYGSGVLDMAYGSYRPEPHSRTCAPAQPYPEHVVRKNSYRYFARFEQGVIHNHLRTFKHKLFLGMDDSDFTYADGSWFMSAGDSALMFPALELSGGRWVCMPEINYIYNSENANSDWRRWPRDVDRANHRILAELQPKKPLP